MEYVAHWVTKDGTQFDSPHQAAHHEVMVDDTDGELRALFDTDQDSDCNCYSQDAIVETINYNIHVLRRLLKKHDDEVEKRVNDATGNH